MAGMKGFEHKCDSAKVKISDFKKSITESSFSYAQVAMILDFYVAHSFAAEGGQHVSLEDYGWKLVGKNREKTLQILEQELMKKANIEKMCTIRAKTIKDTLKQCDLESEFICVEHPRIVLKRNYSVVVDENEKISFGGGSDAENRINCLFRHIRNSFAHANTYFFNNGNVLLEDKAKETITAKILIRQQTLLDWISVIDKNKKYYSLINVCDNCKTISSTN